MKKLKLWVKHKVEHLLGGSLSEVRQQNNLILGMLKVESQNDDRHYRDLIDLVTDAKSIRHNRNIKLVTEYPVAHDSLDHTDPLGTINDNTRNYGFYNKCRQLYGEDLSFLDLGCAGGGIVFEFALNGHVSIGLEGSDISKILARVNWRTIPNNLFCCDIMKEFELFDCTKKVTSRFNVISCWEVLEHIPEDGLETFFVNVKKHSEVGGIFIGSIATSASSRGHHVTVRDEGWWMDKFSEHSFRMLSGADNGFEYLEFCRPFLEEIDLREHPDLGFHFVAQMKTV